MPFSTHADAFLQPGVVERAGRSWYHHHVRSTNRSGFNLLEVVIGVLIFATVMIGLTGVWVAHARSVAKSRYHLLATHLAEQLMETCIAQGWSVQPIRMSDNTRVKMKSTINGVELETEFRYEVLVTTEKPTPGQIGIKKARVRVYWDDDTGKDRKVSLTTLIFWQN